jgi:hypothetical protein
VLLDCTLEKGKIFGRRIDREIRGQRVLLQIQNKVREVTDMAPHDDVIMLALISGKFKVQVKEIGPHRRE